MRLTGHDRDGSRRGGSARRAVLIALALACAPNAVRAAPEPTRIVVLALRGFDPISYFTPEGPQPGNARFETVWNGSAWRFASEANRAVFQRDPGVYAPRLGGYDAAGILDRRLVDADPTVFAIFGDRLYLFRDEERRARFVADPALTKTAEGIWPELVPLLDDPPPVR